MKKIAFFSFLTCIVLSACKEKDNDGPIVNEPQPLHVKLNIGSGYFDETFGSQAWAILSDLEGNILACQQLYNNTVADLVSDLPYDGLTYHLSIVTEHEDYIGSQSPKIYKVADVHTFAFLQRDSFSLTVQAPPPYSSNSSDAYVELVENFDDLENYRVSTSIATNSGQFWNNPRSAKLRDNTDNIYLLMKYEGEQGWRHHFYEDVQAGDTVSVLSGDMVEVPISTVEVPSAYSASLEIYGVHDCDSFELIELGTYHGDTQGEVSAPYPSAPFFGKFRSNLTLQSGDLLFELIQLGEPITEYKPNSTGFHVQNQDIHQFDITAGGDFTAISAYWSKLEQVTNENYLVTNWTVWSTFPGTFKAPVAIPCLAQEIHWIAYDDLTLEWVKREKFSNISSFDAFMDYSLLRSNLHNLSCNAYNFNGEGNYEGRTQYYH